MAISTIVKEISRMLKLYDDADLFKSPKLVVELANLKKKKITMVGSFDTVTAGIVCHITKEIVKKIFQQMVSCLYEMILLSSNSLSVSTKNLD